MWRAFFYSMAGLRDAWREPACRLEIYILIIAVPAAFALAFGVVERLLLIGSVVAILVVEVLNTSVEAAIDRIGPERNELSRAAKDLGSAAVFIASLMAGAVWLFIAGPVFIGLFGR